MSGKKEVNKKTKRKGGQKDQTNVKCGKFEPTVTRSMAAMNEQQLTSSKQNDSGKTSSNEKWETTRKVILKKGKNNNVQLIARWPMSKLVGKVSKSADRSKLKNASNSKPKNSLFIPFGYEKSTTVEPEDLTNNKNLLVDDSEAEVEGLCELDGIQMDVNPADDHFSSESELESEIEDDAEKSSDDIVDKQHKGTWPKKWASKDLFTQDPEVQKWVQELVQENVHKELNKSNEGNKTGLVDRSESNKHNRDCDKGDRVGGVKSPSDSTIYTPALRKGICNANLVDRISDFVDNIRIEQDRQANKVNNPCQSVTSTPKRNVGGGDREIQPGTSGLNKRWQTTPTPITTT